MNYATSAAMYDELIEKFLKTSKIETNEYICIKNGAICHYKQLNMPRACELFNILEREKQLTESDWEMYLLALRGCGQYEKSRELAQQCMKNYAENLFFSRFCNCATKPEDAYLSNGYYSSIQPFSLNSDQGEFAPCYTSNDLYFSSKKIRKSSFHPYYGWDGDHYISLQKSKRIGDSLIGMTETVTICKNKYGHDGPISFNKQEDMLVLTRSNSEPNGHVGLHYAQKSGDSWSELTPFPYNNDQFDVGHGSFANEDNTLYFSSDIPGGIGGSDIYVTHYRNGIWTQPINLGKQINTEQNEFFPFVIDSVLFFSSNGHCGFGGLDLFECHLNGKKLAQNLGSKINTMYDDFSLVFSENKQSGFFSSNRGDNTDRIYHFIYHTPLIQLQGTIGLQTTIKKPLCNQFITLHDSDTKETIVLASDTLGRFDVPLKPNKQYLLIAKNEHGESIEHPLKTILPQQDTIYTAELLFTSNEVLVEFTLHDKATRLPLPFGTVTILNPISNRDTTLLSDRSGKIKIICEPNENFEVIASKKGYIDEQRSFTTPAKLDTLKLTIPMGKIEEGKVFTVENIYYDLDRSTLREQSKHSLDRLATFLIENKLQIELSSHTDSRGSTAYNNRLSQERAESCVNYLLSKGIQPNNIVAKGYGETQLVNICTNGVECSEEEHQKNRRTEVKILHINQ